jgi:hypothetical protein
MRNEKLCHPCYRYCMAYVFRSSNPVEATYAQTFFSEKGYACDLIAIGSVYGVQTYELRVNGEVDAAVVKQFESEVTRPTLKIVPDDSD